MPHNYTLAPPGFAHDPWAWDYTRDRIEANTGIPYDQWQGKHFAGAAAMYKNVVKKYTANIATGNLTAPRECVDCGNSHPHYVDDYICRDCRDLIEKAPSYSEAVTTINNPGALDAIREQLYEALGHAKKDAKAAVSRQTIVSGPIDPTVVEEVVTSAVAQAKVSRNYGAMGDDKLKKVIGELESSSGDSYNRVQAKGESRLDHLEAALTAAQKKGIVV